MFGRTIAGLTILALGVGGLAAQGSPRTPPAWLLMRTTTDRWIHEGSPPVTVQPTVEMEAIRALSSTEAGGSGRLELRAGDWVVEFRVDAEGRVDPTEVSRPDAGARPADGPRARAATRRDRLGDGTAMRALPVARFWDVPFRIPPGIRPGGSWTDTLDLVDDQGDGLVQTLKGVRRNRRLGAKVVDGLTLHLVETRADVTMEVTSVHPDASFDTVAAVHRALSGTIRGTIFVDTAAFMVASGADTTVLEGQAVLTLPYSGTFTSGVRYERERRWERTTEAAWDNDDRPAWPTDPRFPLQAPDSLRRPLRERIREARLGVGDTAGVVLEVVGSIRPYYTAEWAALAIPFLDAPERLWRLGHVPTTVYGELAAGLVDPARPGAPIPLDGLRAPEPAEPDRACPPATCDALIAAGLASREVRFHDAALAGAFVRDPLRWVDSVEARARAGSSTVAKAWRLAQGLGYGPSPLPGPDADWRAWAAWAPDGFLGWRRRQELEVRTALTGADPLNPLVALWPPPGDTARALVGRILRSAGHLPPRDPDSLAADLLSESSFRRSIAWWECLELMATKGTPAPDELSGPLLTELVDSLLHGGAIPWPEAEVSWPKLSRERPSSERRNPVGRAAVAAENLPRPPYFHPPEGIPVLSDEAWRSRDPGWKGWILQLLEPPQSVGPFVWFTWRSTGSSGGGGSGATLVLVRDGDGWQFLTASVWGT